MPIGMNVYHIHKVIMQHLYEVPFVMFNYNGHMNIKYVEVV